MRFALLLLLCLSPALAAEKHYLREFSPAKPVSSTRVTAALQKDKGTVILFFLHEFEVAKPTSSLKFFQKISEEYKDTLLVIGVENSPGKYAKSPSAKDLLAFTKNVGATFPIYLGCKSPIDVHLYPNIFIFDRDGRMLYNGIIPLNEDLIPLLKKAGEPTEKKEGLTDPKKDDKVDPKKEEKPKADPKKVA